MPGTPDSIIEQYDRLAREWDAVRPREMIEEPWLRKFAARVRPGGTVLDLGCGAGAPISEWLMRSGFALTGVDAAPAMIAICQERWPAATWHNEDMRHLDLGRTFDAILAWDSYFHLRQEDQRRMFRIFACHARPGASLLFSSGPVAGEVVGTLCGEPLYHASLGPDEYRTLLREHGFRVIDHKAEDTECDGRTVWLAQRDE